LKRGTKAPMHQLTLNQPPHILTATIFHNNKEILQHHVQMNVMLCDNNGSSYIDRRLVIQLELEEVQKKRLNKSWVQHHVSDDFQTSLSASS
jgi:C4-type Zn-finger protein